MEILRERGLRRWWMPGIVLKVRQYRAKKYLHRTKEGGVPYSCMKVAIDNNVDM